MLKSLVRRLLGSGRRRWTVEEVRELIFAGRLSDASDAAKRLHDSTPEKDAFARCLLAEIAFRERRDDQSRSLYHEVLALLPGFADAHYGLSLLMLEAGEVESALHHAQFARNGSLNDPRYLAQLGLCHLHLKNFASAEMPLRQAIQCNDSDKSSWNNLGIVLRMKGEYGEALACFRKAVALDASFVLASENLAQLNEDVASTGGVWRSVVPTAVVGDEVMDAGWTEQWRQIRHQFHFGDSKAALYEADLLLVQWEDDVRLLEHVAGLFQAAGDIQGAIEIAYAYLARHPEDGRALCVVGSAHSRLGDFVQAEEYLTRARKCLGSDASLTLNLAQVLHQREKYAEAVSLLEEISSSELTNSQKAQLAASLAMACEYEKAIRLFDDLLATGLAPRAAALNGLGLALVNLGRFDEALALLDQVIEQYPAEPNTRFQRATVHLLRHQFAQGWEDYAYRGIGSSSNFRVLPFPRWDGESLEGKTIVVLAEQGLGDQVMFASCLPDLLARSPRRVIFEVIARVAPTLARSFPECEVIASTQKRDLSWAKGLVDVDFYVPLADLPRYFRPEVSSFPGTPYLRADPSKVENWRKKLREIGPGPKLGFSWRGGTPVTRRVLRTLDVDLAGQWLAGLPVTWISLQYGAVTPDILRMSQQGCNLVHWADAIKDLDEFAALICALDAVITVCNTTVHYAGALGTPVWVMAPAVPEWRYGIEGEGMPWYRSARVIRQQAMGDWQAVLDTVRSEVLTFLSHGD
ncbi:MAG: tetratricopeptide repeat protein [Ramlibacter sp.]